MREHRSNRRDRPASDEAASGPRPLGTNLDLARDHAFATAASGGDPAAALAAFVEGLKAYWRHPRPVGARDGELAGRWGARRLWAYGDRSGAPVLIVPSPLVGARLFDLLPERSFVRFLAGRGARPFVLDWGRPGRAELGFDLDRMIVGDLGSALDHVLEATGVRPALLGHCMGGTLAVGLASRRERDLAGLALLAAPWDFHAGPSPLLPLATTSARPLTMTIAALGQLPPRLPQAAFARLEPTVASRFARFARLAPGTPEARLFVALEDWLSAGLPLAGPAAQACLWDWYVRNRPGRGAWVVDGDLVRPRRLHLHTLVAVPQRDRIVAPESALAFRAARGDGPLLRPTNGHVGMIVGARARAELWEPLACWLETLATTKSRSRGRRGRPSIRRAVEQPFGNIREGAK